MEAEKIAVLWGMLTYIKWAYIIGFVLYVTKVLYYYDKFYCWVTKEALSSSAERLKIFLLSPLTLIIIPLVTGVILVIEGTRPAWNWLVSKVEDLGL